MNIKIPASPGKGSEIEAIGEGSEAVAGREKVEEAVDVAPVPRDAVERIASQLVEGTLTKKEAIEQLLAHTMGTQTVQALPDEIQAEVMDVLQAMLETDPHLKSLVAALGPDEDG